MAFERFTQTGRSFRPVVSIWSRGQIGFNQGAVKRCVMKEGSFVVLFFDKDSNKIGLKIVDTEEEGALKPKFSSTGAVISAKSFLDYYEVDFEKTKKYELTYDDDNELYVVDVAGGEIKKDK